MELVGGGKGGKGVASSIMKACSTLLWMKRIEK
jgi:hypothetical protein